MPGGQPNRDRVAATAGRYFDIAFCSAPIGMALFNTDGEYVRVNGAPCSLLGRTEAELLGRRDQEFTHPDDPQSDVDAAWRILRGEMSTWQCEKRFLRSDGTVVWAIANLTFLRADEATRSAGAASFRTSANARATRKAPAGDPLLLAATFDVSLHILQPGGNTIAANIATKFGEAGEVGRSALIASGLVLFAITLAATMAARGVIRRTGVTAAGKPT